MKIHPLNSLRSALIIAVIVALVIPAIITNVASLSERESTLRDRFTKEQTLLSNTIALSVEDPLWNLSQTAARPIVDAISKDSRIAEITIIADSLGVFLSSRHPERITGQAHTVTKPIFRNGTRIGQVTLIMYDGQLQTQLHAYRATSLYNVLAQILMSTIFIIVILQRRLLHPLRLLLNQSAALTQRAHLQPFSWQRNDELGQLGKSLESTRQSLNALFAELEDKNTRLENDILVRQRTAKALEISEDRYRTLIQNAPEAIVLIDLQTGLFIDVNPQACKLYGQPREHLLTLSPDHPSLSPEHQPDGERSNDKIKRLIDLALNDTLEPFQWLHKTAHGDVYVEVRLVKIPSETQRLIRGTIIDITQRKHTEERIQLASEAIQQSRDGIVLLDREFRVLSANPAYCQMLGCIEADLLARQLPLLVGKEAAPNLTNLIREKLNDTPFWESEMWTRRIRGDLFLQLVTLTAIRNQDNSIRNFVCITSDITEQKQHADHIWNLAHHDTITGLPNRNLLQDRLMQAILQAERSNKKSAIVFIDLDRFKNINDTLGHAFGDRLLKHVADRLIGCVRNADTVARIGGDEFVIVLPNLPERDGAAQTVRKIMESLTATFVIDNLDLHITPSIGISICPDDGVTVDSLMRNADTAMYYAKDNGRNNFQFFEEKMVINATERLEVERELRIAIRQRQFELHYQPQIDLQTGALIGMEALIRWRHPQKGLISPLRFIPLAEDTGLIVPIGEWVLQEACRQVREWEELGLPIVPVAVNLSARQFIKDTLVETVQHALQTSGLDPRFLELEITESLLMHEVEDTIALLNRLNELGLSLSIDDFGTGYSSLAYLKRFPIDVLKVDRSFVRDVITDPDDASITAAIIAMAHNLKLRVVAEGVETEEQAEFLRALGCEFAQGYLYSMPLPHTEMALFIRQASQKTKPVQWPAVQFST